MPQLRTNPTFECSFCKALAKSHTGALNHERRCPLNPMNNSICFQCSHLTQRKQACAIFDHNGADVDEKIVKDYHCTRLDKSMMTYRCPRYILNIHPHFLHLMPSNEALCPYYQYGINTHSEEINPSDQ